MPRAHEPMKTGEVVRLLILLSCDFTLERILTLSDTYPDNYRWIVPQLTRKARDEDKRAPGELKFRAWVGSKETFNADRVDDYLLYYIRKRDKELENAMDDAAQAEIDKHLNLTQDQMEILRGDKKAFRNLQRRKPEIFGHPEPSALEDMSDVGRSLAQSSGTTATAPIISRPVSGLDPVFSSDVYQPRGERRKRSPEEELSEEKPSEEEPSALEKESRRIQNAPKGSYFGKMVLDPIQTSQQWDPVNISWAPDDWSSPDYQELLRYFMSGRDMRKFRLEGVEKLWAEMKKKLEAPELEALRRARNSGVQDLRRQKKPKHG